MAFETFYGRYEFLKSLYAKFNMIRLCVTWLRNGCWYQ